LVTTGSTDECHSGTARALTSVCKDDPTHHVQKAKDGYQIFAKKGILIGREHFGLEAQPWI